MSVATLANNGYTTIFVPGQQSVNVFYANNVKISAIAPPALHGWRDDRGFLMVIVSDEAKIPTNSQSIDIAETAMSVYDLPNTKEVV